MTRLEFFVEGEPVPQGSTRAFATKPKAGGKSKVVTTNDPTGRIERWRGDIRSACRDALPAPFDCLTGPVSPNGPPRPRAEPLNRVLVSPEITSPGWRT